MKPVNLTQAQAQHAELSSLMGGTPRVANTDELQSLLEDAERENNELTAANKDLQQRFEACDAARIDGLESIDQLNASVYALEIELEATRDKLQAAGANVDELNAEIAKLKAATGAKRK